MSRLFRISISFFLTLALSMEIESKVISHKMEEVFTWDQILFNINDSKAAELEKAGIYCSGCSVIFDADRDNEGKKYFFSMPHILQGSVVTLGYVNSTAERYNPIMEPYPSWEWHANYKGCDGLTSVFRIHVDKCNRLWVIDSGDHLQWGIFVQVCPPQLLVFDLKTDTLLIRHRFNAEAGPGSTTLMLNVITEHMDSECSNDVYAYIADSGLFILKVFHLLTNRSWTVIGDWFYPEVEARDFSINGVDYAKMVGVLGIAVSPCIDKKSMDEKCDRYFLFHSFSGYMEGRIRTSILRNESLFLNGNDGARDHIDVIGRRPLQAVGQFMSEDGILFFSMMPEHALRCWNFRQAYYIRNFQVVEYDVERINVPMGIKVLKDTNGEEEVCVLSNHIEILFSFVFERNITYPNHLTCGKVKELIKGTRCEVQDYL